MPTPTREPDPALVREVLDPILGPLGFAAGQGGVHGDRSQVIFCRGETDSPDGGCLDLVVDLEATPAWHISDVRYWGFPSERWHLGFDRAASLTDQLAGLGLTLPVELAAAGPRQR
jgi:hypothetical protein